MKRAFPFALVTIMIASMFALPACTAPATPAAAPTTAPAAAPVATLAPAPAAPATAAPAKKPIIGVLLPAMDNPLMLGMSDAFKNTFGADYDVQVVSADGNANTQSSQLQNFTAMGTKFVYIQAAEASSLVPDMIAARKAGTTVMMAGGDPGDPEAYDVVQLTNQYLAGWFSAYLAKQWVEKAYPDAADGSIETALLASTLNTEAVNRTNGLKMISEPYMKNVEGKYIDAAGKEVTEANKVANPAYSSKVKVVVNVEAQMFQAGQTAMQNILTTNPEVKLVIAYAGDGGMGASQAILDEYAKGTGASVIDDLNEVGVFSVGAIGDELNSVAESATNKSVFRGTVRFGGADLMATTMGIVTDILQGKISKVAYDPLDLITIIDGKPMSVAIANSAYFEVPTAAPQPVELRGGLPPLPPKAP